MPGNSWIFRGIADLCWLQNEPRQYTKQRRWSKQEQMRRNRQYLCESPAATRMLWLWTLGRKWPSIPNWSLPVYWVTRSVGRAFSLTDSSLKMARKNTGNGPWSMTMDDDPWYCYLEVLIFKNPGSEHSSEERVYGLCELDNNVRPGWVYTLSCLFTIIKDGSPLEDTKRNSECLQPDMN